MKHFLSLIFLLFILVSCNKKPESSDHELPVQDESERASISVDSVIISKTFQATSPPIPDSISFAGERVPLEREDVREKLEREIVVNTFRHSRTILMLKRTGRWRKFIEDILAENNIPKDFFYMAIAESELMSNAKSGAGAVGMWQFMKGSGKDYGLKIGATYDQRKDPELATRAACKYLKDARKKFKNWTLAAASYNMGMGGLNKKKNDQEVKSFYDLYLYNETDRYVYRILAFKLICEHPETFGFNIKPEEYYKPWNFQRVKVKEDIDDLVEYAKSWGITYKELRRLNPWLNDARKYKLELPRKSTFEFKLPKSARQKKIRKQKSDSMKIKSVPDKTAPSTTIRELKVGS